MGTGRKDRDTDEKGDGQFLIVGRVDEVGEMGGFCFFSAPVFVVFGACVVNLTGVSIQCRTNEIPVCLDCLRCPRTA